jgi:hypothetical protein
MEGASPPIFHPQQDAMDVLAEIRAGNASREVRISAAKGLLPMESDTLVEVLHLLSTGDDGEIRSAAEKSVGDMPDNILEAALFEDGWSPELLQFYARVCAERSGPLEAVILNPATSDRTILDLARAVPVVLMELIVINQVRILREPRILEALLENPSLNAHIKGRVNELKFDFFEKKEVPAPAVAPSPEPAEEPLPLAEESEGSVKKDLAAAGAKQKDQQPDGPQRPETMLQKIIRLDITGKIRLAKMGTREERFQLVKSPNRLICTAAIRSPKLTDSEVDSIVKLRNVHEEVLRYVAIKREWTRRHSVVVNLVTNPRTPIPIAMKFLNHLTPMDLKILSRNKDIPEVIRRTGRQLMAKKLAKG